MFAKDIYVNRRSDLCQLVQSGIILLPGNAEASMNYPENTYHFRQNSHFIYFAGIDIPDLFVAIDADNGETILFADELTMDDIIWTGPKESYKDIAAKSGIYKVQPSNTISSYVADAISKKREIHYLPPYRMDTAVMISGLTGIKLAEIKEKASVKLIKAVAKLRSIKSAEELAEIDKAAILGYEMHNAVMHNTLPGVTERHLAAIAEGIALSKGQGMSFPIILTQRGEVLHGHSHDMTLVEGSLMICDAGAESLEHYASDFTRTIPVSGSFTPIQRDLYQIVLDANNKAFELIKPGVFYKDVHLASCRVLAEGLKSLGVMKGNIDEAVANGAHALFMPHGLGHMMGLDVHDMEDIGENYVGYDDEISRSSQFGLKSLRLGKRLQPGFVLTVEPGMYFIPALIEKWRAEKINAEFIDFDNATQLIGTGGIRIEDDAIVTETGCRMPGEKRLPVTVSEIESIYL